MTEFLDANLSFIVLLAAAVTGIGILWRKVIIPLRDAAAVQSSIWAEFKPNGGKSLHDKLMARLDHLETGQQLLCNEQKALRKTVEMYHEPGVTSD